MVLMFKVSNSSCSVENKVGLLSGANFEDLSMIFHENHTCRWISSFRYGALCQTFVCFILSEAMRLMLLYLKGFLCWYFSLLLHVSSIIFAKNALYMLSGCQLLELICISFCFSHFWNN